MSQSSAVSRWVLPSLVLGVIIGLLASVVIAEFVPVCP